MKEKLTLPLLNAMKKRCGQPEKCEHFDKGTCKCLDNGTKNQKGIFYKLAWHVRHCKIRTVSLTSLMTDEEKVRYQELKGQ